MRIGRLERQGRLKVIAIAGSVILSCATAACGASGSSAGANGGTASAPNAKQVLVGVVTDFSGPQGILGTQEFDAYQLAANEINAAGGIKSLGGAKIVLKKFDTQTDPAQGAVQASAAVADHVDVILGGEVSDTVIGGTNITHRAGIPWISIGAEAAEITGRGFDDVFQVTSTTNQIAQSYYDLLNGVASKLNLGKIRASISVSDTTYGAELDQGFTTANKDMQVVNHFQYPLTTTDFSSVAARMLQGNPNVLLNEGYPTDGVALAKLFASKFKPPASVKVFFATAEPQLLATQLGDQADGMLAGSGPSPAFKGMPQGFLTANAAFKKAYGTSMEGVSPTAWEAFMFLEAALEKAGSTDGSAIAAALHKVQLTQALGNIYPGAPQQFAANGSLVDPVQYYVQIQNGQMTGVYPASIAAASPIAYTP
jgi:branched-chain amino acid transport system substrate-binding protein